MMRAILLKRFRDKFTRITYTDKQVGQEISLSAERLEELSKLGYVKKAPKKAGSKKEDKPAAERTTKEEKFTPDTK